MKNKNVLYILLAVMVVLIVGASLLYKQLGDGVGPLTMPEDTTEPQIHLENETDAATEQQATQEETQIFPAEDCSFYDAEGNTYHLSDFFGKPIVLNFWASWCGPCKSEMPAFHDAYLQYGEDINFVMVNLTDGSQETVQSASGFVSDMGYAFPVYYDTSYEAAMTYGVYGIPVTYFIDAEGNIAGQGQGALDEIYLQQGIDMILP